MDTSFTIALQTAKAMATVSDMGQVVQTVWICWKNGLFTSQAGYSRMTQDFITLIRIVSNLKLINSLFLEFFT